jgi:hypothetical protein
MFAPFRDDVSGLESKAGGHDTQAACQVPLACFREESHALGPLQAG